MWSRRRFLEAVSSVPIVGGLVETAFAAAPPRITGRDYFKELGVRPFINAEDSIALLGQLYTREVLYLCATEQRQNLGQDKGKDA